MTFLLSLYSAFYKLSKNKSRFIRSNCVPCRPAVFKKKQTNLKLYSVMHHGLLVECWKGWGWQQWQEKEEGKIWMRTGRLVVGNDSSRDAIFFSFFFKSGFHSVCAHSYFFIFLFFIKDDAVSFFHLCNQTEVDFQGQWLEKLANWADIRKADSSTWISKDWP